MKAQAVRTKQGWYLRYLPGFDDIRSETVEIDVNLSGSEIITHEYKELRGIAIMERHMEKELVLTPLQPLSEARASFRKKYGYENISGIEDVLRVLQGIQS